MHPRCGRTRRRAREDLALFSQEGGRFRPPIEKFTEKLTATNGIINLRRHFIVAYE